jgi:hypothetical protein
MRELNMDRNAKFTPPEKTAEVDKPKAKPAAAATVADIKPVEGKAKAPKAKKEPSVRRSKFNELYPAESVLTVLVATNPKKKGSKSAERFEGYTGAKTVGEAIANGVKYADIAYDLGRQYIKLG